MGCFPEAPAEAKQTNCWRFLFILGLCGKIGNLINTIVVIVMVFGHKHGKENGDHDDDSSKRFLHAEISRAGGRHGEYPHNFDPTRAVIAMLVSDIINLILWVATMYHIHHTKLTVDNQSMEITMGPWRWPILRWLFSSQVSKHEIVVIERKDRSVVDMILRGYCLPVNWCMCHKSYSAYFWPFCCNGIDCCQLCDGDEPAEEMLQISLTHDPCSFVPMCCKRCAPCAPFAPFTCCVYNRISFAIKDESWVDQFKTNEYPVSDYLLRPLPQQNDAYEAPKQTSGHQVLI